jgi:hypothetical protein
MAKIDFNKRILRDLAGDPIYPNKVENNQLVEDKSKPPITISSIIVTNLLGEDSKATPTERFDNFRLASKIKDAKSEVELTIEEIATIKKKIGENPMPLVVGRVWEVLEGLEVSEPKKK